MKQNLISLDYIKNNKSLRYIKSFTCRHRSLTKKQQYMLNNYLSLIGIKFSEQPIDFIKLFNRNAPVTLEIGFGTGLSLISMAKDNPDQDFIGIEVYLPGIIKFLNLFYKEENLKNLKIICYDAIEVLNKMISDNSLNTVQLFFPDPWQKNKHHKRRIVQKSFAKIIKDKLKLGGILHMVTDWEPYAEYILKTISSINGYKNLSIKNDYISRPALRPITEFELRGYRLGHIIRDLMFEKIE